MKNNSSIVKSVSAIDSITCPLYNEADVRRIATTSAEEAVSKVLSVLTSGVEKLDNCTETDAVSSTDHHGGTDMSNQIKAKLSINGETVWVTGTSAQRLVDNALRMVTEPAPGASSPTFED